MQCNDEFVSLNENRNKQIPLTLLQKVTCNLCQKIELPSLHLGVWTRTSSTIFKQNLMGWGEPFKQPIICVKKLNYRLDIEGITYAM